MAETINGAFLAAELASNPKGSDLGPTVPEDLGKEAAKLLLEEIYRVGILEICVKYGQKTTTRAFQ